MLGTHHLIWGGDTKVRIRKKRKTKKKRLKKQTEKNKLRGKTMLSKAAKKKIISPTPISGGEMVV